MNRLQKRAWIDLGSVTVSMIVAGIFIGIRSFLNQGSSIVGLIAFLIAALISMLVGGLYNVKLWKQFDEREKKIKIQSFLISSYVFVLFLLFSSFSIFFLADSGLIPSYLLPLLFLIAMFIAQFTESGVVLFHCAREEPDGE